MRSAAPAAQTYISQKPENPVKEEFRRIFKKLLKRPIALHLPGLRVCGERRAKAARLLGLCRCLHLCGLASATQHMGQIHTSVQCQPWYGPVPCILGDKTTKELNEYSQVIMVDGNICSGKTSLRRRSQRDEAGNTFQKQASNTGNLEELYDDPKSNDGNSYHAGPAMCNQGFIGKECVDRYTEIKRLTLPEYLPPHVDICIDASVPEIQGRIQKNGDPHEMEVTSACVRDSRTLRMRTRTPSSQTRVSSVRLCCTVPGNLKTLQGWPYPSQPVDAGYTTIPVYLPDIMIGAHQGTRIYNSFRALPGRRYNPGYNAEKVSSTKDKTTPYTGSLFLARSRHYA
ncbi:hypothetical protein U0070_023197, partial [Myodes glareolus]